jgi:hypothetical protein
VLQVRVEVTVNYSTILTVCSKSWVCNPQVARGLLGSIIWPMATSVNFVYTEKITQKF